MKSKRELPKSNDNVIIKRFLLTDDKLGEELFSTELELLTSVKHRNIVTLVGFCVEGFEMVLVIERSSKGYLSRYLGDVERMSILTWEKRLKICIDVAHALHYLHFKMEDTKVIIHGSISNVCIGLNENWSAKTGKFTYGALLVTNQEDHIPRTKSISYATYYVDPEYVKELNDALKFKRE
ncbi:putative receptor-like protein kinase At2g39360 [Bidens hawaiensis]|uniref:putative receptor-like protein kinase At2g39360 n=1 Tax=Bidens hawaiensis TaxID=980011 RepID=UPI00404AB6B4